MTLDEAVKINKSLLDGTYDHGDEIMEEALKLGIEALKVLIKWRLAESTKYFYLLPGETEE